MQKHVETISSGTPTLRKHLITKHHLTHLVSDANPRIKTDNLISSNKKIHLDHLANMAIFEDGRTFGDFRKNGIRKFLAEAIPGYIPLHRNQVQRQLKRLYVVQKFRLIDTLKNVKSISLTADFFFDRHKNSFLCITGHYVDENLASNSTISYIQSFNERHLASNITSKAYNRL